MKNLLILIILLIFGSNTGCAQVFAEVGLYETRAVWLTTYGGLDWPSRKAIQPSDTILQRAELAAMLDKLVACGINTILFQTRLRTSVAYPSKYESIDGAFLGKGVRIDGYDALRMAIEECHSRGLQLHAWVVCMKGAGSDLDPAARDTKRNILNICREIISEYDIDGIHLDYIRYPDQLPKVKGRKSVSMSASEKREVITDIMREVSMMVRNVKPHVVVSCSPIGKYANTTRYSSRGWNARDAVYQDAAAWMREGLCDAIFPMMYFRGNNFFPFVLDWKERSYGSEVVPGLGIYFLSEKEQNWPLLDIQRELYFMRQQGVGQCYFRAKFLLQDVKGIATWLKTVFNSKNTLPRSIVAKYDITNLSVGDVRVVMQNHESATITWSSRVGHRFNVLAVGENDTILLRGFTSDTIFNYNPVKTYLMKRRIVVQKLRRK